MTRLLFTSLAAALVCACSPGGETARDPAPVGLANPASVYCLEKGGKLSPVETTAGTSNDCVLPSGERIDEWDLYRRDHSN